MLSSLPLPLLATLVIGGAVILAVAGLLAVHRFVWGPQDAGETAVIGILYAVFGGAYGVVLAFVVLVVWQRFAATDQAVTAEAAALVATYRDTQALPDPLRGQAQDALRAYANEVMESEWRSWVVNGEVVAHTTPDPLNPVWAVYRRVQPSGDLQGAQLERAEEHLYQLEVQRHLRHLASEATLPPLFWPVLVAGGVLTVGFSYFLRLSNLRLHAAMTAALAALIAGLLLLVVSLDHPFTGAVQVDREPFRHALQQFHALDLP